MRKKIFKKLKQDLEYLKKAHSKSKNLQDFTGRPDPYMLPQRLIKEKLLNMFKLKTRMRDIYENYKNGQNQNMWCRICNLFKENQKYLLTCPKIRESLDESVTT